MCNENQGKKRTQLKDSESIVDICLIGLTIFIIILLIVKKIKLCQ